MESPSFCDTGPPGNGKGALLHAPAPSNYFDSLDNSPLICSAQRGCTHLISRLELMPQGHAHFAREICSQCRAFLRWVPRPETLERQRVNAFPLAKLSMHPGLSDWERRFVRDVSKNRRLSPKQQALILRLVTRYLETPTP